ncbi:hypothetical protein LRY60_05050 [Candidatus Woesebacteria bacterium]|nr:hypothetical protein [Candidatus Woesebacteria bacterium]
MSTFRPNFQISNNLLQYIASIEASREVIKNAPIVPAWEAKFQEEAMVRTVYHGTRLEGNELSQEQAERVLSIPGTDPEKVASGAGIVGKARDIQEIINYRSVLDWINSWGESLQEGERPEVHRRYAENAALNFGASHYCSGSVRHVSRS